MFSYLQSMDLYVKKIINLNRTKKTHIPALDFAIFCAIPRARFQKNSGTVLTAPIPITERKNTMRKHQIDILNNLRLQGFKPTAIARKLDVSVNTGKSYIRRHPDIPDMLLCEYCGKPVRQNSGRKAKRFCSDKCRISYWNRRRRKKGKIYAK